jgi:GNAT superfamily N-acetyltransferase
MKDNHNLLNDYLKKNSLINNYFSNLVITGENFWDFNIEFNWKDIGKFRICSFNISDFWALKDFWNESLNYESKSLFPLFPSNNKLDRVIVNHLKNHLSKRDIIFNTWILKEDYLNADLENEIIGHFFINRIDTMPEPGLVVAEKFQGKKLGTFFLLILIYITKILGKKEIFIRTDIKNNRGFELYKNLGFKHIRDYPLEIPIVGYKSIIRELKMDLDFFS